MMIQMMAQAKAAVRRVPLLLVLLLAALQPTCATSGSLPANMIALRVESNVKDASVLVDDRLVGRASDLAGDGKRLPAGFHRLEVRHPGYYSFFQEIETKGGEEVVVKAQLRELIQ